MIEYLTGSVGILVALVIITLIRKDQMRVSKAVLWLFAAIGFCLLGFAPATFDELAVYTGVAYPPTLAFTIALAVIALKLLLNDIELSELRVRHTRLIQRIAILQNDIDTQERPATPAQEAHPPESKSE